MLGRDRVSDDNRLLEQFSRDQSFAPARRPDVVVYPESVEEVHAVVCYANRVRVPVVPFSSGLNLHGAAVPDHGGILLNLSRMNQIPLMDEKNLLVAVEPGVTYEQLQAYLLARGYRVMIPFGVPPGRSVLTSYLERDPVMAAASFEYGNALIMDTEIILPTGELLRTGVWSTADKPGGGVGPVRQLLYRLWTGAQGTLGVMTKMCLQIHPVIKHKKIFFLTFRNLTDAMGPLAGIQRREIGLECFLLNAFNLAAMLADDWEIPASFPTSRRPSAAFDRLKAELPSWTMVIVLHGAPRHPEEKIAYEEEALWQECERHNLHLTESLPGVPGLARMMESVILRPWRVLKKFNYRGSAHDLNYASPLKKAALMESVIKETCLSNGYPPADIGGYLLPVERGRAVHCEFDLHCDLSNRSELEAVREVWLKSGEALMNTGAYFSRPYGPWAEMIYRRSGSYTRKLKEIKNEIDPNNIMNPGKLCF